MSFPQLYTYSSYSLLQSTIQVKDLAAEAKAKGYEVLALCDRNVLTGTVEFYNACLANEIKPLIGLHLDYYSPIQQAENELLLFAKNISGFQQLIRLSSDKMINGRVSLEDHETLTDLYAVLPERNEITYLLYQDQEKAGQRLSYLREVFGSDQVFFGKSPQFDLKDETIAWYQQKKLPPCAIYEVNALNKEELSAIKVMDHLSAGSQISDLSELVSDRKTYLVDSGKIEDYFQEQEPTALENAQLIASAGFELPLHQKLLPHFAVPKGHTAATYLRELCESKLAERVIDPTSEYQKRLDYELQIIHQMGFDDYFLIVWDVMDYAHRSKIVTGAGRGSAAGSLVSYVLAITDVDPIKYELLFERFLNPERYSMPDIDLDIPDNKREQVLQYVRETYGQYQMAQIATFGTMAAKMVLKDVARVFGLSQSEAKRWSEAVPNTLKITLKEAYEKSARLRELVQMNPKNQRLFEIAQILEGLPRHVSTHAAGVVISDQNLLNLIPLQAGSEGILLTQYTMNDVEAVGLLKVDFLGLRNLSIIDETLQAIKQTTGKTVSQKEIPLDDPETMEIFKKGDTTGVFQFESASARRILMQIEPENIEDIVAANSLNRPGPSKFVPDFARRKKGLEKVTYPDPSLEPILKNTYGIMVYQEQVMQVASQMAGFTLGQADLLRRAIGKKKKSALDEQRQAFVQGAVKLGRTETKANQIYDYIERFANYGFNRSHAFAYSFVGYQMAFLKVHYPGPFFKALLQSVRNNTPKVKEYLQSAKSSGIKIMPPDINISGYGFSLQDAETIRLGLGSMKGTRRDFVFDVVNDRRENGPYKSLDSFLYRLPLKWLKADLIRPLIEVGAFDSLIDNRRQIVSELEGKIQNIEYSGGSLDLLEVMTLKVKDISDFTLEERLDLEEKYLGIYLSGHPTERFPRLRQRKKVQFITDLLPEQNCRLLLHVRDIREIRTKKGEQMAFVEGSDPTGEVSLTIFPNLYRQVRQLFALNDVIYVEGKTEISKYNQELQVIVEGLQLGETAEMQLDQKMCYLKIPESFQEAGGLQELNQLIKKNHGNCPVILYYESTKKKRLLSDEFRIADSDEVRNALENLLGKNNVVFK